MITTEFVNNTVESEGARQHTHPYSSVLKVYVRIYEPQGD